MTNQNTVLIIGSGRSGRGMLGELYHKAGFHIVFADNDPSLVNGLRAVGHYSVEMTDLKSGAKEESVITDFAVLNTVADHAAYIEQLATSRWISTALMPAAFDRVMEDVAEAALLRLSRGTSEPQFITLGANFVGMETYCTQKLRTLLGEDRWNAFSQNTHLIMSIVNRKNLLPRCPDTQDPYRVEGDNKPVLRVEDLPALRNAADRPPFFRAGIRVLIALWRSRSGPAIWYSAPWLLSPFKKGSPEPMKPAGIRMPPAVRSTPRGKDIAPSPPSTDCRRAAPKRKRLRCASFVEKILTIVSRA